MSHAKESDTIEFDVGILNFKISKPKFVISRIKRRGNSFYLLIPSSDVKVLGIRDNDYVVAIIARIINVRPNIGQEKVVEER